MASALSEFNFSRTCTDGFRPSLNPKISSSMKSWEEDNMYLTSTYSMNRFNVRTKYIINIYLASVLKKFNRSN